MINDVGDLADFDGRRLAREDMSVLRRSDCIALVNWSANRGGNSLAKKVFSVKGRKTRLNFLDPADLDGAENRIAGLKKIIDEGLIDAISVNENEARILARHVSATKLPYRYTPDDILRTSRSLNEALHVTVDIHTPAGGASTHEGQQAWVPAFGFVRGFVTGAGDVWDAGDIVGHLLGFGLYDRLLFANACAYLFLSSGRVRPPTLTEVERFLGKSDRKGV
jgi:sugar/nucleoside kinase (ribokinase family)